MTAYERHAEIERIGELTDDADKLAAYLAIMAREEAEMPPVVITCACADLETCAHPWPAVYQGYRQISA